MASSGRTATSANVGGNREDNQCAYCLTIGLLQCNMYVDTVKDQLETLSAARVTTVLPMLNGIVPGNNKGMSGQFWHLLVNMIWHRYSIMLLFCISSLHDLSPRGNHVN